MMLLLNQKPWLVQINGAEHELMYQYLEQFIEIVKT
jgi:hypothetical protein